MFKEGQGGQWGHTPWAGTVRNESRQVARAGSCRSGGRGEDSACRWVKGSLRRIEGKGGRAWLMFSKGCSGFHGGRGASGPPRRRMLPVCVTWAQHRLRCQCCRIRDVVGLRVYLKQVGRSLCWMGWGSERKTRVKNNPKYVPWANG